MVLEEIKSWLGLASLLITVGGFVWLRLTSGSTKTAGDLAEANKKNAECFAALDRLIDGHDRRIQAIEGEFKHLPDRKMVHDLQLTLKDIQIEMASIKSSAEQSTRVSTRVEQWLLDNSRAAA